MKTRLAALALALLLALGACASTEGNDPGGYEVYFATAYLGGPAIQSERRALEEGEDPITGLLDALLSGPVSDQLASPFPDGVRFRSAALDAGGVLTVDLSERYGGLSGVDLTVADYCVALTLCQLPQVEAVSITVEGEVIPYRDRQLLRADDVVLSGSEGEPTVVTASLYFPRHGGGLAVEERAVTVTDTEARNTALVNAVLAALLAGPEDPELYLPLPQGTQLLSADLEDGVCYLNLSSDFADHAPASLAEQQLLLYSVVNTLTNLKAVHTVNLLVEGETLLRYGGVSTTSPLEFNQALVEQEQA